MAHLFISYSRTNETAVQALARDIQAIGHEVWLDNELTGGQAWWDEILRRIRACDLFVFALSPASLDSTACKREYRYAEELDKRLLPILLADGVSINLLPPALSAIQYVDYRSPDRNAALALARTVLNVPPPNPLPDPLPAPPEVPISYLNHLKDQVDTSGILKFDEQAALAFRLKEQLNDPAVADDVRGLMRRFRARPDLLARVAEDIDLALDPEPAPPPNPTPPESTPVTPDGKREPDPVRPPFTPNRGGSARPGESGSGDRRSRPRRKRERGEKGNATSSGRGLRVLGGVVCGFFALSSLVYFAEWGDGVSLLLGIGLAVAAYKLIRT